MAAKSKCVHCGAIVDEWTRDCPKCGKPVANPDAPVVSDIRSGFKTNANLRKKNLWPYIIGIVVILIAVLIYFYKS